MYGLRRDLEIVCFYHRTMNFRFTSFSQITTFIYKDCYSFLKVQCIRNDYFETMINHESTVTYILLEILSTHTYYPIKMTSSVGAFKGTFYG